MRKIYSLGDLATMIGCRDNIGSIRKAVYKGTDTGVAVRESERGIIISGFVEGSQGECLDRPLNYPFERTAFWDVIVLADDEANEEWLDMFSEQYHHEEPDGFGDVADVINEDNNQRAADMNATLRDIGGGGF